MTRAERRARTARKVARRKALAVRSGAKSWLAKPGKLRKASPICSCGMCRMSRKYNGPAE